MRCIAPSPATAFRSNAELIRNLMIAAQYVHDHVMHFYHLHALDWVDVVSALKADPEATSTLAQSLSSYPKSSPGYFADVQKKVKTFVEQGQLGIFANAYWGHPAYKLPPEANLMAVAHYLEALAWQRDVVKLHAIFGGKNPHPNFVVGGVPSAISVHTDVGGGQDATALNMVGLQTVQNVIKQMREFVDQVYVPDTLAIAGFYKDWGGRGEGLRQLPVVRRPARRRASGTPIPSSFRVASFSTATCPRSTRSTWMRTTRFRNSSATPGTSTARATRRACTRSRARPSSTTPGRSRLTNISMSSKKYSWLKSPRWKGKSMEVGPLARVLMMYANGHEQTKELVDYTLKTLDVPVTALFSTLGRTAARTLESKILADAMQGWYDQLIANIKAGDVRTFNDQYWDPSTWPKSHAGRRPDGSAARRPVPLDRHRRRQDQQLPGRGAQHLERRSARRAGPARRLRSGAAGQPRDGTTRNSRSRSCAPSTPSTPASPARCT